MKHLLILASTITFFCSALAQDSTKLKAPAVYKLNPWADGSIIASGVGLSVVGLNLIKNKHGITQAELDAKKKSDIPSFDRGNAGWFSKSADDGSYIPFYVAFASPILMTFINKNERQQWGRILVLYTETMAITSAMFTMATGTVYRSRPYVYDSIVDAVKGKDYRLDNDSHRSFYAGHTASSAAAAFFAAKVFADLNPNSKLKPYVWGVAAALPAVVGYMRYKAGMHFLSDNLLGYVLGATTGILVPQLHKVKALKNVTFIPQFNGSSKGLAAVYHIK